MTTLKSLSKHTGLDEKRIDGIITSLGHELSKLSIDDGRLIIIKALRATASGNTQREQVEEETTKLIQAKRIKITEQIKIMRADMAPQTALSGYMLDDTATAGFKAVNVMYRSSLDILRELVKKPSESGG